MDLSGTAEDLDASQVLTHEWTKVYGPSVTLRDADTLTPYFYSPDGSAIFIWKLTVRDPLGLEHSDNVWVFVDYTPDTQWQDWVPVVPPRYQGSGALREQQHTRAGVYLLPPVDREGNLISDRIPASSGGSSTTRSSTRSTVPRAYVPFVADPFNPGRPDPELDWFPAPEPWAEAGPPQTVRSGETVTLKGTGRGNPEDETLYLVWHQIPEATVTLSDETTKVMPATDPVVSRATFLAPPVTASTDLEFRFLVYNAANAIADDTVTITVNPPPNEPPVAEAGENAYVEVNTAAELNGSGTDPDEDDQDSLTYLWTAPEDSGATILNADHMETSFLAPSTPGDIEFTSWR